MVLHLSKKIKISFHIVSASFCIFAKIIIKKNLVFCYSKMMLRNANITYTHFWYQQNNTFAFLIIQTILTSELQKTGNNF